MPSKSDKINDKEIWLLYSKGVKQTKPRKKISSTKPPEKKPLLFSKPPTTRTITEIAREISDNDMSERLLGVSLDKNKTRKLRQGTEKIEGKLDLHGMKQQEAYEALQRFVIFHAEKGRRTLLVISGKGKEGQSVLRKNFPRWCAVPPLAELVLALVPSAPKHGGEGAWYVVLRKKKDSK